MLHRAFVQVLESAEVCVSGFILIELETLLLRAKFDKYLSAKSRTEFVNILRRRSALFEGSLGDMPNLRP